MPEEDEELQDRQICGRNWSASTLLLLFVLFFLISGRLSLNV